MRDLRKTCQDFSRAVAGDDEHRDRLDHAMKAAIVKDVLAAMRAGRFPPVVAPTTNASVRKTLRDDTEWLLLVADSYAQRGPLRVADGGQPEPVGS
ncbi:DUF6545 domain-containing protein [Streptomyces sp. NPDC005263]|uniref:DUF6545 domain-containing protein n=1 Tax=Streptomyces sp. NPDC005263 TaxID=3364711 RepID=UPI0036B72CDA